MHSLLSTFSTKNLKYASNIVIIILKHSYHSDLDLHFRWPSPESVGVRRINGAGLKNAMPRFFDNQPYPLLGSFQSNCKWLYWSPLTIFRPSDKHSDWGRKHHPLLLLANVIKDFASRNSDKALMLVQTYLICGAGILNVIIQFQFEIPGAHRHEPKIFEIDF